MTYLDKLRLLLVTVCITCSSGLLLPVPRLREFAPFHRQGTISSSNFYRRRQVQLAAYRDDKSRRKFIQNGVSTILGGFALMGLDVPNSSAANEDKGKLMTARNKRIGGLASKIRAVTNIMVSTYMDLS